jgi:hypothetical protein
LIHNKLSEFTFYDVCGKEHRVGKCRQFDALEWNCTVEKKIPGTARIADVLLQNMFTEEVIAIEVYNTHKVGFLKAQECKTVNVHIVEVLASTVNSGIRVLNNQRTCFEWDECVKCVEANKRDEQMRVQREFDRKQSEIRRQKEQVVQRELDELNKQHLIALGKRNRADQLAKDIAIQERETARVAARVAKQLDLDRRARLTKPSSSEEKRVEKMRVQYRRMGIKPTF